MDLSFFFCIELCCGTSRALVSFVEWRSAGSCGICHSIRVVPRLFWTPSRRNTSVHSYAVDCSISTSPTCWLCRPAGVFFGFCFVSGCFSSSSHSPRMANSCVHNLPRWQRWKKKEKKKKSGGHFCASISTANLREIEQPSAGDQWKHGLHRYRFSWWERRRRTLISFVCFFLVRTAPRPSKSTAVRKRRRLSRLNSVANERK